MWTWVVQRRWALGFLAWAALAFTIAHFDDYENRQLQGAPTAPAVITDIDRWTKGGTVLHLRIELPDGSTVESSTHNFYDVPAPSQGARITVQYAVDGQDVWSREAGLGPNRAGVWGWSIAGAAAALTGVILLVLRTRRNKLGEAVEDCG
ncbi:hypothetical protein [Kribbella sp. NPDC000426]|uniref:hypothetical protein n=1 Tax=Kribbella sp. NPDC000426 TaxID=3154255 RepID=UPI00333051EF